MMLLQSTSIRFKQRRTPIDSTNILLSTSLLLPEKIDAIDRNILLTSMSYVEEYRAEDVSGIILTYSGVKYSPQTVKFIRKK